MIATDIADGFYIDDTPTMDALGDTEPATYIGITGALSVGPDIGIADVASAGIAGGISLSLGVSLKDTAPPNYTPPGSGQTVAAYDKANNNDNKTRLS